MNQHFPLTLNHGSMLSLTLPILPESCGWLIEAGFVSDENIHFQLPAAYSSRYVLVKKLYLSSNFQGYSDESMRHYSGGRIFIIPEEQL